MKRIIIGILLIGVLVSGCSKLDLICLENDVAPTIADTYNYDILIVTEKGFSYKDVNGEFGYREFTQQEKQFCTMGLLV